jgi:hypothetical protein
MKINTLKWPVKSWVLDHKSKSKALSKWLNRIKLTFRWSLVTKSCIMNRRSKELRASICLLSSISNQKWGLKYQLEEEKNTSVTTRCSLHRSRITTRCKLAKCNSHSHRKKCLLDNNLEVKLRWNIKCRSKDWKCRLNKSLKNTRFKLTHINPKFLKLNNLTRFRFNHLNLKDKMRSRFIKLKWKSSKPDWLSFTLCLNLSRASSFREKHTLRSKEKSSTLRLKNCSQSMLILKSKSQTLSSSCNL